MSMQVTKVWWDGEKLMAELISEFDIYKPEPKRPQNCGTTYCSCIECVMEPAQPAQQEPVAWALTEELEKRETTTRAHLWFSDPVNCMWTPLYTSPLAQRTWVGLTDDEIDVMANDFEEGCVFLYRSFTRAIEAKLREKNA